MIWETGKYLDYLGAEIVQTGAGLAAYAVSLSWDIDKGTSLHRLVEGEKLDGEGRKLQGHGPHGAASSVAYRCEKTDYRSARARARPLASTSPRYPVAGCQAWHRDLSSLAPAHASGPSGGEAPPAHASGPGQDMGQHSPRQTRNGHAGPGQRYPGRGWLSSAQTARMQMATAARCQRAPRAPGVAALEDTAGPTSESEAAVPRSDDVQAVRRGVGASASPAAAPQGGPGSKKSLTVTSGLEVGLRADSDPGPAR